MSKFTTIRTYWRVIALVVLLIASTSIIVSPGGGQQPVAEAGNQTDGLIDSSSINLKYGLELSGGTSVRAPLIGISATGLEIDPDNRSNVSAEIADRLEVDSYDVRVRVDRSSETGRTTTVDIYQDIPTTQLEDALEQMSVDTTEMEVTDDVSQATYDEAEETLRAKIVQSGLSGGSVTQSQGADGTRYVVVQVPNKNQNEVIDLIGERGLLRIVATYPVATDNGSYEYQEETVLTQEDIHTVAQPERTNSQQVGVPVTLTDQAGKEYVTALHQAGFLQEGGISNCDVRETEDGVQSNGYCLVTYKDSEFLHGGGIAPGLAQQMQSGDFQNSPTILLTTTSQSEASKLQITLKAGAMPTEVDIENGTITYLSASQASNFKVYSLLIGILTVCSVALTVAYRYRERAVAGPMILTALSEVWILLGFVSLVQLPLDLSHIAGLIAVVGTGVDDLIIIADEVLVGGDIKTTKVFDSRFKKAFWIIGVAAITTIIAMSPLAILSLGDLQGFAIVTIVGVLIGVLITRPAYGDILKWIVEKRNN